MDQQSEVAAKADQSGQQVSRFPLGYQLARSMDEVPPALLELWRIVAARKWLVLSITVCSIALGLLTVRHLTPIYRSTATILIEQGGTKVVSIEEVYSGVSANKEYLVTQAEFLKSRNVAVRVINKLQLASHPEFAARPDSPGVLASARSWLKSILVGGGGAPNTESERIDSELLRAFQQALEVQPVRQSQLVSVSFESADRKLAANIANAVAEAYVEADMDARYAMVQQANAWLAERVETLRAGLAASEQALQAFRDRKGILNKESGAQGGATKQLEGITQQLVEARVRRTRAEQEYNQARALGTSNVARESILLGNPAVARADQARAQARQELADASRRFGSAHPSYQAAEAALAVAQRTFEQAANAATVALGTEYEAARAVERGLEQAMKATRGTIQVQDRDEFELARYAREVATNRQLYETFVARLKETAATSGLQTPVGRVVDPAVPSFTPSRPSKSMILLLAALGGVAAGVASAMMLHRFDRTIRTVEMAESKLQYPVITALPRLEPVDQASAHRLVPSKPGSTFSEAIRTARTSIQLSGIDSDGSKVVLVTSALANEGKSTFALNLGFAQGQTKKTLLIEADMRRPTYAKLLGIRSGRPGLVELIAGTATLSDCLYTAPDGELQILGCGAPPPNPLELLSSQRFRQLLSKLRSVYEVILIDTPPVSLVSDAVVAAAEATAVLFVIRAGSTPYQFARHSLRKLGMSGAPILGLVLNDLDFQRAQKYYGDAAGYSAGSYGGYSEVPQRTTAG